MSAITQVAFEANGLSLHTENRMVRTWGQRNVTAPKRGEDVLIPGRRGRRYRPKTRDAQVYTLSVQALPWDDDGQPITGMTLEEARDTHWKTIEAALDVEGQYTVVKRWWDGDGNVVSASGTGETSDQLVPEMEGGYKINFDLSILMADPYFYGALTAAEDAESLAAVTGDVATDHVIVKFDGGVTDPKVTFDDGNWIQYDGLTPGQVVLDHLNQSAKVGSNYVNGKIRVNPSFMSWPTLRPGDSALTVSAAGIATVQYEPAYR